MAITRTQIAKQLLEQGGRVGLRGGGADMGTVSTPGRAARDNREIGARMSRTAASGQGDAMRRNQEAFNTGVGISDLKRLQKEGVPDYPQSLINSGLSSILLNSSPVKKFRNFALNKNIERYKNVTQGPYTLEGYKDYMKDMRDRFTSDDDDDDQIILPQTLMAQAPSIVEEDDYYADQGGNPFTNRIPYRLMNEGGMADKTVGGIMDLESSRQMYGLGKLVKKVTRTVKKIAKSPIGKAALLYAGGSYLSGMGALKSLPGAGFFKPAALSVKAKAAAAGLSPREFMMGIGGKTPTTSSLFSSFPGGKVGAGIFGASALAGLMTPKQEEEETVEFERGEPLNIANIRANPGAFQAPRFMAEGGSTEEKEPVAKKVMPLLDMDGKEKDYRETGGFVDMGRMEKADDVPARLSKNEFVFTADAVRNAGDGSVDKGAEVMYNMMKNLESGGDVSEESQGLEGARDMFQTSQRLEEVL